MNANEIKAIQSKIGVTPDGFWGPKSITACQKHLRALMPNPNPWPKPDQTSLCRFYGNPGDEKNLVTVDFPFTTFYEGKKITKFRCHKKVADSLVRVLKNIGDKYGKDRGIMAVFTTFATNAEVQVTAFTLGAQLSTLTQTIILSATLGL